MTVRKIASLEVLGPRVRWARKQAGLSLRELERLTGVRFNYISEIERNIRQPSVETLIKLATALGVPVGFLLGEVDLPDGPQVSDRSVRTIAVQEVF